MKSRQASIADRFAQIVLDPHNHRSIGALLNAIAYYYFGIIKSP